MGALFGTFCGTFLLFFLNVLPHPGEPASAAVRVPTVVNAESRCNLAGGWRCHESSSLFRSSLPTSYSLVVGESEVKMKSEKVK